MKLSKDSGVLLQGFEASTNLNRRRTADCDLTSSILSRYAVQMKAYGTNVVAAVIPGLGGQTQHGIAVFDLVEQALPVVGPIDTTIIFVPPCQALDAALEAIAAGIRQIIITSDGMPPLDMVHLLRKAEATETLVLGPSSLGIIVPGKILLGIQESEFYTPGAVGIVSRSSTLTYEVALELTRAGLGQSVSISIGNDAILGSSFHQWLQILDEDEATEAIVLIGEPGSGSEEAAAEYITEAIDKPVIAYIAGCHAPTDKYWGQTGTLATVVVERGAREHTAKSKIAALRAANVAVAKRPSQIPKLVRQALKSRMG
ncbi:MAG: CoA-binding protein [Chroococcidiopsidaceae cyanobacterium CP_BM_ER_R8_30]|nr:CoA-binding protein [Chroococcidiopsidaceae cyanobacterium CP_BM_ER_R8_30]